MWFLNQDKMELLGGRKVSPYFASFCQSLTSKEAKRFAESASAIKSVIHQNPENAINEKVLSYLLTICPFSCLDLPIIDLKLRWPKRCQ